MNKFTNLIFFSLALALNSSISAKAFSSNIRAFRRAPQRVGLLDRQHRGSRRGLLDSIRGGGAESIAGAYSNLLSSRPILTKSSTSGIVFALSDVTAQLIAKRRKEKEGGDGGKLDTSRMFTSLLIGLCYFGPAAVSGFLREQRANERSDERPRCLTEREAQGDNTPQPRCP